MYSGGEEYITVTINKMEFKCQICMEEYDSPRILPCQHNLCRRCLWKLVRKHCIRRRSATLKASSFPCPSCRRTCKLGNVVGQAMTEDGVLKRFPENRLLNQLQQRHMQYENTSENTNRYLSVCCQTENYEEWSTNTSDEQDKEHNLKSIWQVKRYPLFPRMLNMFKNVYFMFAFVTNKISLSMVCDLRQRLNAISNDVKHSLNRHASENYRRIVSLVTRIDERPSNLAVLPGPIVVGPQLGRTPPIQRYNSVKTLKRNNINMDVGEMRRSNMKKTKIKIHMRVGLI
ncbi:hypothetical protein DPMN_036960 [Dreissena polymorpha]|uniref:RING-type domain-containing protein n=1 Tax=Dreissena polymorpha TaxID=45954 RepID=A0A9D4MBS8_DREPO|nr:hypothetical protein DPMN_036960 [Dreissena polymorpha]